MIKNGHLLIIEDDEDIILTIELLLNKYFNEITSCTNSSRLPALLKSKSLDVVLLDMNFHKGATSGTEGLECLKQIKKLRPEIMVVMMTAYGDIEIAVQAIKNGAIDFIVKPWTNEKFIATVLSAYKHSQSGKIIEDLKEKQNSILKDFAQAEYTMVGESALVKELLLTIEKVAKTEANVLILGENGTGKELVARAIHDYSARSNKAFINVDLGALSETLFESELFGHVKGAYTDAKENRIGRFEIAEGGTLFLDEIGNLKLEFQSKLLSVLQNREIFRLGNNTPIPIDVRLVCATNLPLSALKDESIFRQDLLYRINTVEITVPPLRERTEDIPVLARHFIKLFEKKYNRINLSIAGAAIKKLQKYNWPGNIRELRYVIERAIIMCSNSLLNPEDFVLYDVDNKKVKEAPLKLEEIEKKAILNALQKHRWNFSAVAKEIGIGRTTLYRKIEKYGLQ